MWHNLLSAGKIKKSGLKIFMSHGEAKIINQDNVVIAVGLKKDNLCELILDTVDLPKYYKSIKVNLCKKY